MTVAQMVIGSWNRSHGAGKNLASKLAAANAEFDAAQSFEAFYHQYSDTSLWSVFALLLWWSVAHRQPLSIHLCPVLLHPSIRDSG